MNEDRRTAERVRANLPARWEGAFASREGTVTDVSTTGCFVLSEDVVRERELLRLEVELPTGRRLHAWGEVVYRFPEVGFALRFTGLDSTERGMMEALIDYAGGNSAASAG